MSRLFLMVAKKRRGGELMDNLQFVKCFAPGAVGGRQVVDNATDEELYYLIVLGNEAAELRSRMTEVDTEIDNLKDAILRRKGR